MPDSQPESWRRANFGEPCQPGDLTTVNVGGVTTRVHERAAAVFERLGAALIALGYQPRVVGGYNCRPIANSNTISSHAWGLAIDVDPSRNPQYATGTPIEKVAAKAIADAGLDGIVGWGGRWSSPDAMHFEIVGDPGGVSDLTAGDALRSRFDQIGADPGVVGDDLVDLAPAGIGDLISLAARGLGWWGGNWPRLIWGAAGVLLLIVGLVIVVKDTALGAVLPTGAT